MMLTHLLIGALLAGGAATMPENRAMKLEVLEQPEAVEVRLVADSAVTQKATYEIKVVGSSRSTHRGTTTLSENEETSVSTMKVSHNGTWCVMVEVSEETGASYSLEAGDCSAARREDD